MQNADISSLGYDYSIVERKVLLQSLYDQLLKKNNVYLNKQVETASQTPQGVVVKCRDGSEYHGVRHNIVVD